MGSEVVPAHRNHDRVQEQIDRHKRDGNSDSFFEATQKNQAKNCDQRQCHAKLMFQDLGSECALDDWSRSTPQLLKHQLGVTLALIAVLGLIFQDLGSEWVLDDVSRGVSG